MVIKIVNKIQCNGCPHSTELPIAIMDGWKKLHLKINYVLLKRSLYVLKEDIHYCPRCLPDRERVLTELASVSDGVEVKFLDITEGSKE